MKKHYIIGSLLLIISVMVITGCGRANSLIGSWEHSGYVYTFNKNKTGSYGYGSSKRDFEYEDRGTLVVIKYKGDTVSNEYEYRIDDNKLIIKDSYGQDVTYIKK